VLYGDHGGLTLQGSPGNGALARVVIPLTMTPRRMAS
jgi:hypothetical protein